TAEITRQNELVRSTAEALAWNVAYRPASMNVKAVVDPFLKNVSERERVAVGAFVRSGKETAAVGADKAEELPEWVKPGLIATLKRGKQYYFAAYAAVDGSQGKTEVFLYREAPTEVFESLLPSVATVQVHDEGQRTKVGGVTVDTSEKRRSGFTYNE